MKHAVVAVAVVSAWAAMADMPVSYRWHFNGVDGTTAPTSVMDVSGSYTLELSQFGSGTLSDQTAVATADISGLVLDGGDFMLGEGFVGNLVAARFSPQALAPERFMVAKPVHGICVIVR